MAHDDDDDGRATWGEVKPSLQPKKGMNFFASPSWRMDGVIPTPNRAKEFEFVVHLSTGVAGAAMQRRRCRTELVGIIIILCHTQTSSGSKQKVGRISNFRQENYGAAFFGKRALQRRRTPCSITGSHKRFLLVVITTLISAWPLDSTPPLLLLLDRSLLPEPRRAVLMMIFLHIPLKNQA